METHYAVVDFDAIAGLAERWNSVKVLGDAVEMHCNIVLCCPRDSASANHARMWCGAKGEAREPEQKEMRRESRRQKELDLINLYHKILK